jgi:two-component system cell cycle sensor histidine kinase/response regulator CckA
MSAAAPTHHNPAVSDTSGPNLRVSPDPNGLAARRILLLEDDGAFRDIIQAFLAENGFDVVPVKNGVEGVHEVLAGDFDAILCDMLMPALPGDMFYRAVERMRPHLCDRFIFMTGYRGNTKINEFINTVNGMVLIKPFHMDDLQEMIAFVELRDVLAAA